MKVGGVCMSFASLRLSCFCTNGFCFAVEKGEKSPVTQLCSNNVWFVQLGPAVVIPTEFQASNLQAISALLK